MTLLPLYHNHLSYNENQYNCTWCQKWDTMATFRLQPPAPFSFKSPDEWPKWKRRFEQFRAASGLNEEAGEKQVCTLLYSMGEDAEDTLASTNPTAEEKKDYDVVIQKFDEFFKVRKNVIFERARFNKRCQGSEESVEQFITSLYSLADGCDYGEFRETMIRDRIVVGIRDKALSESLQMDAKLTLDDAKRRARQREAVSGQQGMIQDKSVLDAKVEHIKGKKNPTTRFKGREPQRDRGRPKQNFSPAAGSRPKCTRCGRGKHSRQECPAREAVCHLCKKRGHFQSQCFHAQSQQSPAGIAVLNAGSDEEDTIYLNTIGDIDSVAGNTWLEKVRINDTEVMLKIDTGAEVTVITEDMLASLDCKDLLQKPNRVLCGPDGNRLQVVGQLDVKLTFKNRVTSQTVYVLRKLKQSLLGLPAIRELSLISQINEVDDQSIRDRYPVLFKGLGTFKREYEIKLKQNAQPHALYTARTVSLPLRKQVKEELNRMESLGVITKIEQATEWCAGMVVVPKKSGSVRICVDFRALNESVLREVHPLPTVDETLAHLSGASVFSKLDANSGFWQIPLADSTKHLTTFITPYGRYCFNKLPFGISSAPEYFQRCMMEILAGQEGVLCHIDDVIIFGKDKQEHDNRLHAALRKIQAAGVTLNSDKCEFHKSQLRFLGHIINGEGISADPSKTSAILKMKQPTTVTELRRFMGMVNQLGKFTPHLAELAQPLRELLSIKKAWTWGPPQEKAFQDIKNEMVKPSILAIYNPDAPTKISSDASAFGLGAVLLQQHSEERWEPVAYASRFMSETEQRYSQIEKEALGIVWACDKFKDYILGKKISLETDHKPLVPLLGMTSLANLPPRILRFRLRLSHFQYTISHVPGKLLYTADTLSRAPVTTVSKDKEEVGMDSFVKAIVSSLPANDSKLEEYRQGQEEDDICSQVISYCQSEWPNKANISQAIQPYWTVRTELSYINKLLLYRNRIVVPKDLQKVTLEKIHQGHQGISKCHERVLTAVWWPGVFKDLDCFIKKCPQCTQTTPLTSEPLLPTTLPSHPWERVAADLCQLKGSVYLVVVDYFSRYIEVKQMTSTTATKVIEALKSVFSRYGIPEVLMSDNGPQFACSEMEDFAAQYKFRHITSSPLYPQSNGLAERSVKTVKGLLRDAEDPYLALLAYRATPLPWCHLSPAELLMGRKIRTVVPQTKEQFKPNWPYLEEFKKTEKRYKQKQKENFDKKKKSRPLPPLDYGTTVWVNLQDRQVPGTVSHSADAPRSYHVNIPSGQVRRNRRDLRPRQQSTLPDRGTENTSNSVMTRSRTGASMYPPDRLTYYHRK